MLRADLLHGAPAPKPVRVYRTRSEQIAPTVAARINELSSRWCAAHLASDTTAWPMPQHPDGFYAAWRTLAHRDPTLHPTVRSALRAVPERGRRRDTGGVQALGVADTAHRDYLIAHLTHQPGWAAHIRWHNDHTEPNRIRLLDYLAIRLTYEALLLEGRRPPTTPSPRRPPGLLPATGLAERTADVCAALGVNPDPSGPHHHAVARC